MTLDDLLAAFENERIRLVAATHTAVLGRDASPEELADSLNLLLTTSPGFLFKTPDGVLEHWWGGPLDPITERQRVWRAAKVYVIARDEGIDAALLWKLSQ